MTDNFTPALTVIMVTPQSYETCRTTISYLRQQTVCEQLELVIVAPSRAGLNVIDSEVNAFGDFQVIEIGELITTGQAMAQGVREARASLVTYGEEHSYPEPRWAEILIEAHHEPYAAVGCALGNANPKTLTSWAHLFGQFGPTVAPARSGVVPMLAGHHAVYKREILLQYGDLLGRMLENDNALYLDLRARGHTLYLAGEAVSYHVNVSQLTGYCKIDFLGQRGFATARAQAGNWSWARRVFYAAATPLVPFLRMSRSVRVIFRSGRAKQLLPQILVPMSIAMVCGMAGEMLGYLKESTKQNFTDRNEIELNRDAFLAKVDNARMS